MLYYVIFLSNMVVGIEEVVEFIEFKGKSKWCSVLLF